LAVTVSPTSQKHYDVFNFYAFRLHSASKEKLQESAKLVPPPFCPQGGKESARLILPLPLPFFQFEQSFFAQSAIRLDVGNPYGNWHFRIESNQGTGEKAPYSKAPPLLLLNEIITACALGSSEWGMDMGNMLSAFGSLPEIGGSRIEMSLQRRRPIVDMADSACDKSIFDYRGFAQKHGFADLTLGGGGESTVRFSSWFSALLSDYRERIDAIRAEAGI